MTRIFLLAAVALVLGGCWSCPYRGDASVYSGCGGVVCRTR